MANGYVPIPDLSLSKAPIVLSLLADAESKREYNHRPHLRCSCLFTGLFLLAQGRKPDVRIKDSSTFCLPILQSTTPPIQPAVVGITENNS